MMRWQSAKNSAAAAVRSGQPLLEVRRLIDEIEDVVDVAVVGGVQKLLDCLLDGGPLDRLRGFGAARC